MPATHAITRLTIAASSFWMPRYADPTERVRPAQPPVAVLGSLVDQCGGVVGDVEVVLARGTLVVAGRRAALGQVELGRLAVLVGHHRQEVGDAVDARPLLVVGLDLVP